METQTLNATLDCIKETTTFSERIITNVCTGQVTVLPFGFWETILFGGLATLMLIVLIGLLLMIFSIVTDTY